MEDEDQATPCPGGTDVLHLHVPGLPGFPLQKGCHTTHAEGGRILAI